MIGKLNRTVSSQQLRVGLSTLDRILARFVIPDPRNSGSPMSDATPRYQSSIERNFLSPIFSGETSNASPVGS